MSYCIGIDPGKTGAIALYGSDGSLQVWDMPARLLQVGNSRRLRVDPIGCKRLIGSLAEIADLAVIEAVGGRPKQSAGGAFVFGFATGLVYACVLFSNLRIESVTPAQYKRWLKVKGKVGDNGDIMARADEIFPLHRELFRGSKGGARVDRAEAAMMAKFGVEVLLGRSQLTEPHGTLTTAWGGRA